MENPFDDIRLLMVRQGKKKVWIIANIVFNDEGDPESWSSFYPPATFKSVDCIHDMKDALSWALFHRKQYEVFRGKIQEIKK